MQNDIILRSQEAIDAIANGVVELYDVLTIYGEEVYNLILSMGA